MWVCVARRVLKVEKVLVVAVVAIMSGVERTHTKTCRKPIIKSVPSELQSNALTDVGVSALQTCRASHDTAARATYGANDRRERKTKTKNVYCSLRNE